MHPYLPLQTHAQPHTSTFEILSRDILEIDEVITSASQLMDTSPTTERIAPVEFGNKSRKHEHYANSKTQALVGKFHYKES
jgi:hypothetical protein